MIAVYIILYITSLLFYILYKGAFSFYLFAFLTLMPVVIFIINEYLSRKIKVSFIKKKQTAAKSSRIPLVIKVENKSVFPAANMTINIDCIGTLTNKKDTVKINTPVYPKDTQYLKMQIYGEHYGNIKVKLRKCVISDFLKLFRIKVKKLEKENLTETEFTIVPDYIPIENNIADYSEYAMESNEFSKISKGDDPSEIFDIHEYTDGDRISRIHWKLTAKQDKTMVKDYSLPITNAIVLLIDFGIKNDVNNKLDVYDTIIESVSAISRYLTENSVNHKAVWFDIKNNTIKEVVINDDESCQTFITSLLYTNLSDKPDLPLIGYAGDDSREKCGHLIYFSSNCDDKSLTMLDDSETAYRYTYMFITDTETTPQKEYGQFTEVINVVPGEAANSLADLCL